MKIWVCFLCLVGVGLFQTGVRAGEICVYVSPTGGDNSTGDKAHPLKTLVAARNLIRSRKGAGAGTVYLRGGTYRLRDTFSLGASDSDVAYRAYGDEQVILSGGEVFSLKDFNPISDPAVRGRMKPEFRDTVLELDVSRYVKDNAAWPDRFKGYAGWPEIYVADKALHLARWPNDGYAKIAEVIDGGSRPRWQEKPDRGGLFRYEEDEPSRWNTNQPIYLNGYWYYKWSDDVVKVAHIDREKKTIKLAAPHSYGIGGPSGGLYYAINLPEELDRVDEYIFDCKSKKVYIIPPAESSAVDFKGWHISFMKSSLLKVTGASDIKFTGITFEDTIGRAAVVGGCENVVFQNCIFRNISDGAVSIGNGKKCGLDRCHIYNIGKTVVGLSGGDRKKLAASGHYVTHCHIHHFARLQKTYCPAVRLSGVGQRVANNYIHDAPHNAVFFSGNDHLIENNRIERVCLDTADAGAIYTGRDWTLGGTVIRRNWIANLGRPDHHNNWGVYLDDVASGIEVRENIFVDAASGILVGGGRNNIIADNLFVRCKMRASIHYDNRGLSKIEKKPTRKGNSNSTKLWTGNGMWRRLKQVPYHQEPWVSRFPYLIELDKDDQPGMPKNGVVSGNRAFNSAGFNISQYADQFGKVLDNVAVNDDLDISLSAGRVVSGCGNEDLKKFSGFDIGPLISERF